MNYEKTLAGLCALPGPSGFEGQAARAALELAAAGRLVKGGALTPVYHRLSQAERERLARERNETKGRGIHDV